MNGLLDFKLPELDTPQGQGLLAAAFNLMSAQKRPGQKGAIGSAIGDAGRSYMQTSNQATDAAMERKYMDAQMEAQQIELEAARRAQAEKDRMNAYFRNMGQPQGPAQAMANGQGPTIANAQRLGQPLQPNALQVLRDLGPQGLEQFTEINSTLNPKPEGPIKLGENDRLVEPGTYRELVSPVPKSVAPEKDPEAIRQLKIIYGDGTPAYRKALQQFGAKVTSHQPATSLTVNTPFETAFSKASGGNFAEMYGGINQQGFRAPAQMRNLERIEQLLEGVDGGRLAPTGMELASIANSFGVKLDPKLGNKQAAESLTREMALAMREPGTGPMTDKDFNNFMDIVPGLSKTAEGRKQIMTTMKNKHARDMKISKMARDYVKQNGKLDEGFLDIAADFMAQNPVVATPKGYRVQRLP